MTLDAFFRPHGVVFVGATTDPQKLGFGVARNLVGGFSGPVRLVGRSPGEVLGHAIHTSIEPLPDGIDLAVILVPAEAVPEILDACGRLGVRAAIVASGGFKEVGERGEELERICLEIARRHGMRLLGPNCIGVIDTSTPLDTSFLPPPGAQKGPVAFLSHSGATVAGVIDWARTQGLGFSRIVSLGNQADVTETDLLPVVAGDSATRVVTLNLEQVSDGRRFIDAAAASPVPVVAFRAGASDAGSRAASSHTGALAGNDVAFDAAFRRAGIIRVDSLEGMFDAARALAWQPLPAGRKVAVLTNAGGPGVAAVDALVAAGLSVDELSSTVQTELRRLLPPAASVMNPVDMLASASPEQYAESLRVLLQADEVDAVVVIIPPPPMYPAGTVADALIPVVQESGKPVLAVTMGGRLVDAAAERLRSANIPDYRFPKRAAAALGAMAFRASWTRQDHTPIRPTIHLGWNVDHQGWLPPSEAFDLVRAAGIPALEITVAASVGDAVAAADRVGYPVALKADIHGAAHKSDIGGVILDVADSAAVAEAFERLMKRARLAGSEVRGVIIQPMARGGLEVIVGVVRDPQFGPLLMFGSGGAGVEAAGDVAFAIAPPTAGDLEHLLGLTVAGRILRSGRGDAFNVAAVEKALVGVGALAEALPELAELEINPLVVRSEGVVAVDVRARGSVWPGR